MALLSRRKKQRRPVVTRGMLREQERWTRDEVRERIAEAKAWRVLVELAGIKLENATRYLAGARQRLSQVRRAIRHDTRKD